MSRKAKLSRSILVGGIGVALVAAVTVLMLPKPHEVDIGEVSRSALSVTIVEEGRTNVRETYIVSAPVAGRLMRVRAHAGDEVLKDKSIVARMLPTTPTILDSRTREQAEAAVEAASAAVRLAQANLDAALAGEDLSQTELERTLSLYESEIVSKAALDRAASAHRASSATRETAEAAIAMREAELANARASLVGRDDMGLANAISEQNTQQIPLFSPIDGRILQVFQQSETVLQAGTPIMEIGDITSDLEVVVQLISSDAVKVTAGDPVILRDWGQDTELSGRVTRVDPFGATKTSALGIEEQRVRVEIEILSPVEMRNGLGHGYRLEAAIVVWHSDDSLVVPTNALFRSGDNWSVFKIVDGIATTVNVSPGKSDGALTEVLEGLSEADQVILYPTAALTNGSKVVARQ